MITLFSTSILYNFRKFLSMNFNFSSQLLLSHTALSNTFKEKKKENTHEAAPGKMVRNKKCSRQDGQESKNAHEAATEEL